MHVWTSVGAPELPPAPLVGRSRDITRLTGLLTRHRLVTVTGTAGLGKSRLAATAMIRTAGGPAVTVRVQGSGPAAPGTLTAAVVQALALRGHIPGAQTASTGQSVSGCRRTPAPAASQAVTGRPAASRDLTTVLPASPLLLLLDDVDPAHAECTGLVQRLLMAAPALRVLVTSRRPLGLGDERVLRLAPLRTEPRDGAPAPAVRLFLDRARRAAPEFAPADGDLPVIGAICGHLEGNPLAIELAAAQVAHHPLRRLAALTARRQCWLSDAEAPLRRHRSLRAAVGADYVLCDRDLRMVWGRAGVFAGSFAESTAVFLCAGGGVTPDQVPSCLARLAVAGILTPVTDPGGVVPVRYRMTRAAREFGTERLREAGEYPVAAERRALHCRRVAAVAADLWHAGSQHQAVQLARDEHADVTAAVRHALTEPGQTETALETVLDLWFWWGVYDHAEEGGDHLLRLLPLCDPGGPLAVRALWLTAWLRAGTHPRQAGDLLARAWPAAVRAGDDATAGRIAHAQGVLALHRHDLRAAAAHFEDAARIIPPGAPGGPSASVALSALAIARAGFAPHAARRSAHQALTRPETRDDAWACAVARYARAFVDHRQGRTARAWRRAGRALADLDGQPPPLGAAALRRLLADLETGARDTPRAPVPRPGGTAPERPPNAVDMPRPAEEMPASYRHMM
ncbi:ATP-binding protein [Streptomyces sp. NPDC014006]|uniref:ATP-binding protein n=1 Tax=Streptomyces sp. NPDC014006 TaxID=3364870 RepID=UPI0036FBE8CB